MKNVNRFFAATSVAAVSLFGLTASARAQTSTTTASSSTTVAPSTTSTTVKPVQILPMTCENALSHGAWVSAQPKGKRRNDAAKSDCGKQKNTSSTTTIKAPVVAGVSSTTIAGSTSSTIAVVVVGSSTTTSPKTVVEAPGKSEGKGTDDKAKANNKVDEKAKGNSANAPGKAKK